MRLISIPLVILLLFLTSCDSAFVDDQPQPQPVQSENITEPTPINTTPPPAPTDTNIFIPRDGNLTVYFLDVNGVSSIIQYNDNSALVNTGYEEDSKKVLKSVRDLGIDILDYAFSSNTQPKNIGGMPYIILKTEPNAIIESGIPSKFPYNDLYNESIKIKYDRTFELGKAFIRPMVVYDDGYGFAKDMNDNSLVIKIIFGNVKILLMSDCGMDCEERLKSSDVSADILEIADSCDSTSLSFLQKVNPDIVIVPTTDQDFCPSIISRFDYLAIPVYITGKDGDIFVTTDGLDYHVGHKKA